jgi:hypothetical protein
LKTAEEQIQIIMTNQMPSDVKLFKVSIASLFLFQAVGMPIGFVLGFWGFLPEVIPDGNVDWSLVLRVAKFAAPLMLLVCVIMTFLCYITSSPTGLSPDGIYASSLLGVRRFIRWMDIARARKLRLLNLQYLRINSSVDGKETVVPLFQAHKKEFRDEIRKYAPPDSPILNFLN